MFRSKTKVRSKENRPNSTLQSFGSFFGIKSKKNQSGKDEHLSTPLRHPETRPSRENPQLRRESSPISISSPLKAVSDSLVASVYESSPVTIRSAHNLQSKNIESIRNGTVSSDSQDNTGADLDNIEIYSQPFAIKAESTRSSRSIDAATLAYQENARKAICQMQEAFAKGLKKKRDSGLAVDAEHASGRYRQGQFMSFEALLEQEAIKAKLPSTLPAIGPSPSTTEVSKLDLLQQKDSSRTTPTQQGSSMLTPRMFRSTSLHNIRYGESCDQEIELYSRCPLPAKPVPANKNYYRETNAKFKRKKQAKKESLYLQSTTRPSQRLFGHGRRYSCPSSTEKPVISENLDADSQPSAVDIVFGALIFFYWMSSGRRFCDPSISIALAKPGTRCLSIGLPILNFEREYPLSKLTIFKDSSIYAVHDEPQYSNLPYETDTFDAISANILTTAVFARHWEVTLSELRRVLKPGGRLEMLTFSMSWLNAGPKTDQQGQKIRSALRARGFFEDNMLELSSVIKTCGFSNVYVAHLAMPVAWGGRIASVWERYTEPLRARREDALGCFPRGETSDVRWEQIADEIRTNRSCRAVIIYSARK